MAKIIIPPNCRRIIDAETRKIRIVKSGEVGFHRVAQQRAGESMGSTARILCEPFFLIGDLLTEAGKGIAKSDIGISAQYGWQKTDRNIAVRKQARALAATCREDAQTEDLRNQLVREGVIRVSDAAQMNAQQLARAAAEAMIDDPWVDQESFIVYDDAPEPQPEYADEGPTRSGHAVASA